MHTDTHIHTSYLASNQEAAQTHAWAHKEDPLDVLWVSLSNLKGSIDICLNRLARPQSISCHPVCFVCVLCFVCVCYVIVCVLCMRVCVVIVCVRLHLCV